MSGTDNYNDEKITGIILDIFISILIAIPFSFIDRRTAFSVGTICIIILLLRRFM
jgi:hypothetical protein